MLYNEKVLAKRVGTRTAFAVNFTRTESVYQMIKVIAIRRKENDMKKARIFAFVMLVVLAVSFSACPNLRIQMPRGKKRFIEQRG